MRPISKMAFAASTIAVAVAAVATPVLAQSSGSVEFEKDIVVSGRANKAVAGVDIPDTPKAKQVLNAEFIQAQVPGQSINETINQIPGVSFANQDPFGSQGGTLYIRGFDSSRISETFDGIPLNDTGNYALYSNQMLDPELIDTVSVNLGTTDVDSPTASATGSTVNYRSRNPTEDFHVRLQGTVGSFNFQRVIGIIDTGNITKGGLRAWLAASSATNDVWYGGVGKINKKEYNFKLYQPLGSNGDFISLGGHWNSNRNNASTSLPWRTLNTQGLVPGSSSSNPANRFPTNFSEAYYTAPNCTAATTGASCFERRYNPSDTANLRANSRFTLNDHMVLNVDPYLEYSKANGGGSAYQVNEGTLPGGGTGYNGPAMYLGYDYNGNGVVDTTGTYLYGPSMTQTYRFGVMASLRYEFTPNQIVRLAYTYDRGRHKQTGELSGYNPDGTGTAYFPSDNPVRDVNGIPLEKRNRLSYAILHQISGEYSGKFLNDALNIVVGLRMPFFKRNLTNNCITTTATTGYACYNSAATTAAVLAANPTFGAPQQKIFTFNAPLPSAGFTLRVAPSTSLYFNYSRTLQVPGTDTLYNTFYAGKSIAAPRKEMGNNFDLGFRYKSSRIAAQAGAWYTILSNRITSAYDPDANASIYTNLGRVDRYGIDGSISYKIDEHASAYLFGSWLHSKIRDNSQASATTFYQTAGKFESGIPEWMVGGRLDGHFGPVDLGIQGKYTGSRWENDQNLPQYLNPTTPTAATMVSDAKLKAFTVIDLNAKLKMGWAGLNDRTFLQLNVSNLFNDFHVASLASSTGYTNNNLGFVYMGSPRTFTGSINMAF